ncbi:MAG TPA: cytochrome c [Nannocystaceae bacterium]|nr:cytochrome c [Nannocystaceae bacterium]
MTKSIRLLALSFTLAAFACDDGGEDAEPDHARTQGVLDLQGDTAAGATVFMMICGTSACHGADGNTPGTADTKKLSEEIPGRDDRNIVNVILKGEGPMPPQEAILNDQQIADVLAYVRDTFG